MELIEPSPPNLSSHKPTILIVDDTPVNLETLYHYFESLGFEIMMAQSGQAALKRVQYAQPDIILLDALMPDMDGFETCRRLKTSESTKNIPVIFMTALAELEHKVRGFQEGAVDYITKPFHLEEVLARVQTHLALRDLQKQMEVQAVLAERGRLARELHDSVTQLLYSINLFAKAGKDAYSLGNTEQGSRHLSRLEETASQALKEMRLLLYELRPVELEQEGLVGAIQLRLDAVEGRVGVKTQLLVNAFTDLPKAVEKELYHLIQEALNNVLKHASATSVTVQIKSSLTQIEVAIIDDGIGFDPVEMTKYGGLGLTTMRERAKKLGGELLIHSVLGQGTMIQFSLKNSDTQEVLR